MLSNGQEEKLAAESKQPARSKCWVIWEQMGRTARMVGSATTELRTCVFCNVKWGEKPCKLKFHHKTVFAKLSSKERCQTPGTLVTRGKNWDYPLTQSRNWYCGIMGLLLEGKTAYTLSFILAALAIVDNMIFTKVTDEILEKQHRSKYLKSKNKKHDFDFRWDHTNGK